MWQKEGKQRMVDAEAKRQTRSMNTIVHQQLSCQVEARHKYPVTVTVTVIVCAKASCSRGGSIYTVAAADTIK
jgi:hypothetical protein